MRRAVLLLTVVAAALLVASGVALAATVKGTPNSETLTGTDKADNIIPFNGDDTVYGDPPVEPVTDPPSFSKGAGDTVHHSYGNDKIYGGPGNDTLRGGFGSDEIWGGDGADLIDCAYLAERGDGATGGYDIAHADSKDTVVDCQEPYQDDPTSSEPPLPR